MHEVGRRHRCPRLVRVPGALRRGRRHRREIFNHRLL